MTTSTITTSAITNPSVRHDFFLMFEATDSNPNGDPDTGDNEPRTDPSTNVGIVTGVCLKRKIRNLMMLLTALGELSAERFDIFIQSGRPLNSRLADGWDANGFAHKKKDKAYNAALPKAKSAAAQYMAERYFDVRMFGGVLGTGDAPADSAHGPIQIGHARSVDPIEILRLSITRCATTKGEKDADTGEVSDEVAHGTFGSQAFTPYGLYIATGSYEAPIGMQTGITEDDLARLWQAMSIMFEHDMAAGRTNMATRGLWVFTHDSVLGNAPRHKLWDLIKVTNNGVESPRKFSDYTVAVNEDGLPAGVELTTVV